MRTVVPFLLAAPLLLVACAHTETTSAVPAHATPVTAGEAAAADREPRPTAPRDAAASPPRNTTLGVSLTGEVPYLHRYDPSGWSGTSTPPEGMELAPQGLGGGPPAVADEPDHAMPAEYDEPDSVPESTSPPKPAASPQPVEPAPSEQKQPKQDEPLVDDGENPYE